jgi:hypothetical protein
MSRELHQVVEGHNQQKEDFWKKSGLPMMAYFDDKVDQTFGFLQSSIHECFYFFSARIKLCLKEGHQNNKNKVCS